VSRTTFIRVGWLIDGSGRPARPDVLLKVEAGLIAGLEEGGEGASHPAERPLLDLAGRTIIPGLVDAHVHLFMSPTSQEDVRRGQLASSYQALEPVMAGQAAALLRAGVLAARDGGDYGGFSLRFRDERLPGTGLRLASPGRAWHVPGRYGRLIGRPPQPDLGLAGSIRAGAAGLDHVKLVNSGLNSLAQFGRLTRPQFSPAELRAAVTAAGESGLQVMVHANGPEPVASAVRAGCRSIEHGFFMGRDCLKLMADLGCVWVPTAVTMQGLSETLPPGDPRAGVARLNLEAQLEQLALARDLGVRVACGSDSGSLGVVHGRSLAQEMALFVRAGFGLEEAVAAASALGAELLGLDGDLGRLTPGRPATFLVFEGPPAGLLQRLGRPERILLRGRPLSFPGDSPPDQPV